MRLLLDLGNSRLKWCWHDGSRRLDQGAIALADLAAGSPPSAWVGLPAPDRVLAVSVGASSRLGTLSEQIRALWGRDLERLQTPRAGGGIRCAYPDPSRLGTDRWVAMVAARRLGALPAVVVDCGTAITLDWVDVDGLHRGGVIAAGVKTQIDALGRRASGLAAATSAAEATLFATDTPTAIAGGAVIGAASMVDGLVRRMEAVRGAAAVRWLAGGDGPLLHAHLGAGEFRLHPDLVLDGLAFLAEDEP
jgi:type III pantothenate kinase